MESISNTPPRSIVPPPKPEPGSLRGSMVLVIVGVAAAALGGMLYAAASSPSAGDNRDVLSGLGLLLLIAGIPSFSIGLLVEFFSIGTSLRSLARSSDATLSLLISRSHPGSEIQNSESPSRPAA